MTLKQPITEEYQVRRKLLQGLNVQAAGVEAPAASLQQIQHQRHQISTSGGSRGGSQTARPHPPYF